MSESACKHCDVRFTHPPSVSRQYCTRTCFRAAQRLLAPLVELNCERCGGPFTLRRREYERRGAKYCSAPCSDASRRNPDVACKTCGVMVHARVRSNGTLSEYCSKTCAGSDRQERVERACHRCSKALSVKASRAQQQGRFYCSRDCQYPPVPPRPCESCQSIFTPTLSELERGWGRFCSNACRRTRTSSTCATCQAPFDVVLSKVGVSRYCSVECRGSGKRNRMALTCSMCSVEFERPASTAVKQGLKFCTRACLTAWKKTDPVALARIREVGAAFIAQRAPTRCEEALYAQLDELQTQGLLVGWERQYRLSYWTVDAAVPSMRLVVQADGEYWHGRLPGSDSDPRVRANMGNDQRCNQSLRDAGWTVLRLWESELLRNSPWCRQRIIEALAEQRGSANPGAVSF